ncbi:MAG: hypothetical protein EPN79_10725 [Burkholderiaceae bacterium]|nr:MAG: hypothetical protein EPN79_10725 [Burkholderiaceae bacterium]TBR76839.1 MAG: hypothetical protein EPN64_06350 [Burkholderiaceae bacterium]
MNFTRPSTPSVQQTIDISAMGGCSDDTPVTIQLGALRALLMNQFRMATAQQMIDTLLSSHGLIDPEKIVEGNPLPATLDAINQLIAKHLQARH